MPEKTGKRAVTRFLLCSVAGICVFFVRVNINGSKSILIDHMISWLKSLLSGNYVWILLLLSGCYLFQQSRQKEKKGADFWFFYVQAVLGFIICAGAALGLGGESFRSAAASAVNATGNILCAVFLSSVFVPLLVDYGLVDAVGILCSPFMRKVFKTPGSSAVIGVSAFLGNYSVGHLVSRKMYEARRFTEKEMVIVALGFSTCSIGLMLNLVNYLDLMDYWGRYVVVILVITFATTAVVSRLYPIRAKKEEYYGGGPCGEDAGSETEGPLLLRSWKAGIARAADAPNLLGAVKSILLRVFPVICGITSTSMFVIVLGTFLASNTDVFYWIGSLVRPILSIAGLPHEEIFHVATGVGVSVMEPVLAGVVNAGKALSLRSRWVLALVPYSGVVFFAGFIPSIYSCRIPCRIGELVLVWIERVVISTVLALLLCPV